MSDRPEPRKAIVQGLLASVDGAHRLYMTKEDYLKAAEAQYDIGLGMNWTLLSLFESEDNTTGSQTLNCTAGACEVVDIGVDA